MYELGENGKIEFSHNPFSMPQGSLESLTSKDPLEILAYQYDIVCYRAFFRSCSRNHDIKIMEKGIQYCWLYKRTTTRKIWCTLYSFSIWCSPTRRNRTWN